MLGLYPEAAYSFVELPVVSGTRSLLYTDGLIECSNVQREEFGKERCKRLLQDRGNLSTADFADRLLDSIAAFSGQASGRTQEDDITILVLDFQ